LSCLGFQLQVKVPDNCLPSVRDTQIAAELARGINMFVIKRADFVSDPRTIQYNHSDPRVSSADLNGNGEISGASEKNKLFNELKAYDKGHRDRDVLVIDSRDLARARLTYRGTAAPLQDGEPADRSLYPSSVGIRVPEVQGQDDDRDGDKKWKTAATQTKLGPKQFLVAAHVIWDYEKGAMRPEFLAGKKLQIGNGPSARDGKQSVTIQSVAIHPAYAALEHLSDGDLSLGAPDVAIITLKESTPSIKAAKISGEKLSASEKVMMQGYGGTWEHGMPGWWNAGAAVFVGYDGQMLSTRADLFGIDPGRVPTLRGGDSGGALLGARLSAGAFLSVKGINSRGNEQFNYFTRLDRDAPAPSAGQPNAYHWLQTILPPASFE
jgi:hypothetical protein